MPPIHSDLPIITPGPPRKTTAQKYGGLFYLGMAGLVVLIALIGWFAWGIWSLREVFCRIYLVNDPRRPESERIEAAFALSRDPRVTPRQRWDLSLSRTPPPLARYLLAESLTSEAIEADPKGFAAAVAYSEGWSDWLRLLLIRPLAYGAGEGEELPAAPMEALQKDPDPILALWATYARAAMPRGDESAASALARSARDAGPNRELAAMLLDALRSHQPDRNAQLDRATRWLRTHHPGAARLWRTWEERDGRLIRVPAPELHAGTADPGPR
jgi:hypothetical protein